MIVYRELSKMKLIEKNRHSGEHSLTASGEVAVLIFALLLMVNITAPYYTQLRQGKPAMYEGTVVYVEQRHNQLRDYDYTVVKIRITIDDVEDVRLWGHHEFNPETSYQIYVIRRIEKIDAFPWWNTAMWEVKEVIDIGS